MWLLFAFSGPVFWAISTHVDKYLVDKYFKDASTAVLMVFTGLIDLLALPFMWYFVPSVFSLSLTSIAVMAASGAFYMGAMLFYLRAIQSEEASVVAPLFQTSILWSVLLAYLFLGEVLTLREFAGVALVLLGALTLAVGPRFQVKKIRGRLFLTMLACTFVLALSSVVFKFFAVDGEFWQTTFWTFAGAALFGIAVMLYPGHAQQFAALFKKNPGAMTAVNAANELINLGGNLGVRYAFLFAPVSVVQAISSTTTLFIFDFGVLLTLFAPRFGREDLSAKNLLQKGAAAILVALGLMFINHFG